MPLSTRSVFIQRKTLVNEWITRSIELANQTNYLDRLAGVYPLEMGSERELPAGAIENIQRLHRARDGPRLVAALLQLDRFPIDYPYAAMLKTSPGLSELNPDSVRRIATPLLAMDFSKLLALCVLPKAANTQIGPMFHNHVRTLGFPVLDDAAFDDSNGPAFLEGGDRDLQIYANRPDGLDCSLRKGLDVLFKTPRGHYIGEAKFFSSTGGNQNKAFDEALDFLGAHRGNATRIAVLDGAVWFDSLNQKMQREIRIQNGVALSALLLNEYIQSVS